MALYSFHLTLDWDTHSFVPLAHLYWVASLVAGFMGSRTRSFCPAAGCLLIVSICLIRVLSQDTTGKQEVGTLMVHGPVCQTLIRKIAALKARQSPHPDLPFPTSRG